MDEIEQNEANMEGEMMREIQERVRGGKVAILFTLVDGVVASEVEVQPYYVMGPRNGYLHASVQEAMAYFSTYVPDILNQICFEYEGERLDAHLPIGVLFDRIPAVELPWKIDIRMAMDRSIGVGGVYEDAAMKAVFFNSLKEANFLIYGNPMKVNGLGVDVMDRLWQGLREGDSGILGEVHQQLCPGSVDEIEFLPIKVVTPSSVFFKPIRRLRSDLQEVMLGEYLHMMVPNLFPTYDITRKGFDGYVKHAAWIHGILSPYDIPLSWLMQSCTHADQFVYVIIR